MVVKKKASRKKGSVTVNFSGVESGGRRCPDGDYIAEITDAELTESKDGNPMINLKWKITEGKFKGTTIFDHVSLLPQALWRFRNMLEALGIDPQEEDVEAKDYVGEIVEQKATIVIVNETYEGEQRPKVTAYAGAEGEEEETEEEAEDEETEEEEEPRVRNAKKKGSKAKDDDEEEEEEESEDDDSEEEEEEEAPAKGSKKGKVKEGSRVKFTDDDENLIKGTVTSLDDGVATVEDKNGDEYEIDVKHLTPL